jgi:hypothetical protein
MDRYDWKRDTIGRTIRIRDTQRCKEIATCVHTDAAEKIVNALNRAERDRAQQLIAEKILARRPSFARGEVDRMADRVQEMRGDMRARGGSALSWLYVVEEHLRLIAADLEEAPL